MDRSEFISVCLSLFETNQIPCSSEQAERLFLLTERMLEVNRHMNLTAITDKKTVILRHYVDSLTISAHIPACSSLMDVGCGAGFPSLPLAIFRPDLTITSLDGTAKRIAYVNETAVYLGLSNLSAVAGRAEEYANRSEYREKFDVVTARAVASLPILSELCLPFAKVGGRMIAMKSQQADDELSLAAKGISICGGDKATLLSCNLFSLENEEERRNLILIPKVSPTPKNYPRHFSKISKKPL